MANERRNSSSFFDYLDAAPHTKKAAMELLSDRHLFVCETWKNMTTAGMKMRESLFKGRHNTRVPIAFATSRGEKKKEKVSSGCAIIVSRWK